MRHLLFTQSVYDAAVPLPLNRRRLAITAATAVASVRHQAIDEWVVAVRTEDPLGPERRATFEASGLPVTFAEFDLDLPVDPLFLEGAEERAEVLSTGPLTAQWLEVFYRSTALFAPYVPDGPALISRLDDDDAYAIDAAARLQAAASGSPAGTAWVFDVGAILTERNIHYLYHPTNGTATYRTDRPGDLHPFATVHLRVAEFMDLRCVDDSPGWLWVRHGDNLTVHAKPRDAGSDLYDWFSVDWRGLRAAMQ